MAMHGRLLILYIMLENLYHASIHAPAPQHWHTHTTFFSSDSARSVNWFFMNLRKLAWEPPIMPYVVQCLLCVCKKCMDWTCWMFFFATNLFEVLLPIYALTFCPLQFSLPSPQGGRDAITKNLILREDQLPQKFLYPKTKKKVNKEVGFFVVCIYLLACV